MNVYVRELVNVFIYLGGVILLFIVLLVMFVKVFIKMLLFVVIIVVILFGIGMMVFYMVLVVYYSVVVNECVIYFFRKLDYFMIFILIVGIYVFFCLIILNLVSGLLLFCLVYVIVICGIVFKMFWFNCLRWLLIVIYIMMGWLIVLFFVLLVENLSIGGIIFLVFGGIFYIIGGFIYGIKLKWLEFKYMGYYEIFYVFVLLGSFVYFLSVYCYVI